MSENFAADSVRNYFARLQLRGQSRTVLSQWPSLPVTAYFVALQLPMNQLNRARKACGASPATLGSLFANIKWA